MDNKFKEIMKLLRKQDPNELQMQKWKNAVRKETKNISSANQYIQTTPQKYWGQMAAAVFIGVVLGGLLFGNLNPDVGQENIQIAYEDATTEVIYTNL